MSRHRRQTQDATEGGEQDGRSGGTLHGRPLHWRVPVQRNVVLGRAARQGLVASIVIRSARSPDSCPDKFGNVPPATPPNPPPRRQGTRHWPGKGGGLVVGQHTLVFRTRLLALPCRLGTHLVLFGGLTPSGAYYAQRCQSVAAKRMSPWCSPLQAFALAAATPPAIAQAAPAPHAARSAERLRPGARNAAACTSSCSRSTTSAFTPDRR